MKATNLLTLVHPPTPTAFSVGQLVTCQVKGVSNDRTYRSVGRIVSIHGTIAKVRHKQPWAPWHNCMRETPYMLTDLKPFKPRNEDRYQWL